MTSSSGAMVKYHHPVEIKSHLLAKMTGQQVIFYNLPNLCFSANEMYCHFKCDRLPKRFVSITKQVRKVFSRRESFFDAQRSFIDSIKSIFFFLVQTLVLSAKDCLSKISIVFILNGQ